MNAQRRSGFSPVPALVSAAILAVLAAGLPAIGSAQDDTQGTGFDVFSGRVTFKRYCASCHGREARGDGNVAQYLRVAPADLTKITSRYGEFPAEKIRAFVDGRTDVAGHGTREMPVWGDVFQSSLAEPQDSGERGEERAERMIGQLVRYLESIQAAE